MQQLLKLIKKGDRHTPTVYQFGANEHLNIHRADQYADLTDANTGACIRIIGWDGLRDMGYCPARLLEGDTDDQRLPNIPTYRHLYSCAKQVVGGVAVAITIAIVGSLSGCNSYLLAQLEQDVATSTIEPRLAYSNSVNQDDLDDDAVYFASNQYANAKYANQKLAEMKRTTGGTQ